MPPLESALLFYSPVTRCARCVEVQGPSVSVAAVQAPVILRNVGRGLAALWPFLTAKCGEAL